MAYEVNEAFFNELLKTRISSAIQKAMSLIEAHGIKDDFLKENLKNLIGQEFRELRNSLDVYQSARGAKTIGVR